MSLIAGKMQSRAVYAGRSGEGRILAAIAIGCDAPGYPVRERTVLTLFTGMRQTAKVPVHAGQAIPLWHEDAQDNDRA
ncbi:MAG: hypothetical protein GY764_01610 [Halieaceae bacterium]|nr:hypothetical protein [Halieaceae bacterium]